MTDTEAPLDFEHPDAETEDEFFAETDFRQWTPGVDAFVIGSKDTTGFCSWFWAIFSPKCGSLNCLVAGNKQWFAYRIDPALDRPVIGQPALTIAKNPGHEFGEYADDPLPTQQVEVGKWKSYAKERWFCRAGGVVAGVLAWVVTHGSLFEPGVEPMGPFWLFVLVGLIVGHEISLRFRWAIRGPLDYLKFRLQRRCWWAFNAPLYLRYLRQRSE